MSPETQAPLRTPEQRLSFCDRYFTSVGARTLLARPMYREYELPADVDKELIERPFYWMWVEATHQSVEPTVLRLAFDAESHAREEARLNAEQPAAPFSWSAKRRVELVDFGSPLFDRILLSAAQRGRIACVREGDAEREIVPWMMVNGVFAYTADLNREEWFSYAVCLDNLQIVDRFYERIQHRDFSGVPAPDLLRQSRHTVHEAWRHLQRALADHAAAQDDAWAQEAMARLKGDLAQLSAYYESLLDELTDEERSLALQERDRKQAALIEKSAPRIECRVHQVALVGLCVQRAGPSRL
ncbi:YqhG family protein [Alicyclobacillus sendaiensis]|uniref:YqhG family protein n=1 Tax=Alicyclobacillus sendaiensis TaxID=192387 RepID=UPI0026F4366F|nr:YqhG family protein [Alicyclobacillus sendaiensis]